MMARVRLSSSAGFAPAPFASQAFLAGDEILLDFFTAQSMMKIRSRIS